MLAASEASLRGYRILVVEDEATIAIGMENILRRAGAEDVAVEMSLKGAEEVLGRLSFDVAILDVRLADGSTNALARELLDGATPVVFHSGHVDETMHSEFASAFFCDKPAPPAKLIETVVAALSNPPAGALNA